MAIDITIKSRKLFKTFIKPNIICGKKLKYGFIDESCRLTPSDNGSNVILVYNPACISRGFTVTQPKKGVIELRQTIPTSSEEIADFLDCTERIVKHVNGEVWIDDEKTDTNEIKSLQKRYEQFNLITLNNFIDKTLKDDSHSESNIKLFCAHWPLSIGEEELQRFKNSKNTDDFRDWMHKLQSIDAYFAAPKFYRDSDGKILGRYVLTVGVDSIFPTKPAVPFGVSDENNEKIEPDSWTLAVYDIEKNATIIEFEYSQFIRSLPTDKYERYDGECILIQSMTAEELLSLKNPH